MADDSAHPFQPGVKVALVTRSGSGAIVDVREAIVKALSMTGNFTLDGGKQQYRACYRFYDRTWEGVETGGSSFRTARVEMITDALKAEVAHARRTRRFMKMQNALGRLRCPDDITDAELDALQAAIDAFAPPKGAAP
jgi:nitroreductase